MDIKLNNHERYLIEKALTYYIKYSSPDGQGIDDILATAHDLVKMGELLEKIKELEPKKDDGMLSD